MYASGEIRGEMPVPWSFERGRLVDLKPLRNVRFRENMRKNSHALEFWGTKSLVLLVDLRFLQPKRLMFYAMSTLREEKMWEIIQSHAAFELVRPAIFSFPPIMAYHEVAHTTPIASKPQHQHIDFHNAFDLLTSPSPSKNRSAISQLALCRAANGVRRVKMAVDRMPNPRVCLPPNFCARSPPGMCIMT